MMPVTLDTASATAVDLPDAYVLLSSAVCCAASASVAAPMLAIVTRHGESTVPMPVTVIFGAAANFFAASASTMALSTAACSFACTWSWLAL